MKMKHFLLASLAAAAVAVGFSGAAIGYALTHVPEVDPAAQPTPVAAIAQIAAEAATAPGKLEVLTPPVYGPNIVSEAPAAPFVPVSAKVKMDAVDLQKLAEADGVAPSPAEPVACDEPCDAPMADQPGYVARDAAADARQAPAPREAAEVADDDDDGNAPPPPDMVVN